MALFSPEVLMGFLVGSLLLTFVFQALFIFTGAFGYMNASGRTPLKRRHPELEGVESGEPLLVVKFDPTDQELDMMSELQERIEQLKEETDEEPEDNWS